MPHEPAGRPQTPAEGMRPLMTPEAVCGVLGVHRNALARYRAAGLPFVILAPGVYRYRRAGGSGDGRSPRESSEILVKPLDNGSACTIVTA